MEKEFFNKRSPVSQPIEDLRPVESEVDAKLFTVATQQAIGKLPERLQFIVSEKFWSDKTFEEISRNLDVTRERTRQLQIKAIKKLKNPLMEFATPDQIKLDKMRKEKELIEKNVFREDVQLPVPKTVAEKTYLKGSLSSRDFHNFIFTELTHQTDDLPGLKQFPNHFSCHRAWSNAARQLKTRPNGQSQYFFTGGNRDNWFMIGALMHQKKSTDFESSRQSWKTETEKRGLFPIIGKVTTEPVKQTSTSASNKPFVPLESIYQFLTDERELSFLLTRVSERTYWIFRTKDSKNIEGEASKEGFDEFRKYWYGVLKNKKAFTMSGLFMPEADSYNRKVGLQICNKHNLLVYQANEGTLYGGAYFHRIS